jgi:hypothetical protein
VKRGLRLPAGCRVEVGVVSKEAEASIWGRMAGGPVGLVEGRELLVWESSLSSTVSGRGRRLDLERVCKECACWELEAAVLRCGSCLQSTGKSWIAIGPLGSGSVPVRGVSLSKSRIRESFFLQVVTEQRRRKEPPEDLSRSTLEAIEKGVEGCVITWRGVN